jgi:UDP-N-acetylmuramoyl-tripeptide--D-alanyl-D-alanine ligase
MPEPLWAADEILAATGGRQAGGPFNATGVSIDTRTLEPGDLFVALAGVKDGHDFVSPAIARGAAAALVSRTVDVPSIVVPDTLAALEKLGLAARDRCPARRCAVTGSVGKTSVTQAIRAGLIRAGRAHSSVKSYNNHIGVPLTLARMPRDTERAVFEIGMNHAGEITPLVKMVAPDVAVITTVGPVHTENFPDGEAGVARAKAEIFDGLKPGGVAILNADNQWFDLLRDAAVGAGAVVRTFGTGEGCEARLTRIELVGSGSRIQGTLGGVDVNFPMLQSGAHWGLNSMAVLLALQALEVDLVTGLAALAEFQPLEGRGAEYAVGGFTLIDESYNANPISMAAAMTSLAARQVKGRRIVALTDMLELGADAARFHAALAQQVDDAGVDLAFAAGPLM